MNILAKTTGQFTFLNWKHEHVNFTDFKDIPEDLSEFASVIKFLPDVPPPPHTLEEHEILYTWNQKFKVIIDTLRDGQRTHTN
jgi:hypothetical protein